MQTIIPQSGLSRHRAAARSAWHAILAVLVVAAVISVVTAPQEQTMGHAQRVMYMHVSVAWLGLLAFVVMAATGAGYLVKRQLAWDDWSHAAGELGWLCSTLTLVTGSLWAHAAWGTWWTWEPRLLASFILWAMYCAYLLMRSGIVDPHRCARLAAVVAILGLLDVPLVVMATRWFRGMHPVAPEMEPSMRLVLLLNVFSFTALFATLFAHRALQMRLERRIAQAAVTVPCSHAPSLSRGE